MHDASIATAKGWAVAFCLLAGVALEPACAQLSRDPMLRIDTGGVVAMQRAVAHDERSATIYTGGDDKAIRVWRKEDLRLLDTWRVPSGDGPEGQINALALSPDGRWLVAGGWTGRAWDKVMSIYVFDTVSGQITRRLTGITPAIGALRFSPDGIYLAVGLIGKHGGVLIIRFADSALLLHDADYEDSALGLDMTERELAVVALDGKLRRYDYRKARLLQARVLDEGRLPIRVAYSPAGNMLAVGFHDVARPAVYSAADLSLDWWPSADGVRGQANLSAVAWSPQGDRLFAAGDPAASAPSRVFAWPTRSSSAPSAELVAQQRVAAIESTADGSLIVLAEDPIVELRRPDGRMLMAATSGTIDYRPAARLLDVSRDGTSVRVAGQSSKAIAVAVDIRRLAVSAAAAPAAPSSGGPSVGPARLTWREGQAQATFSGRELELKDYEFVHAATQTPDGRPILGTEFGVRLYGRDGALAWFAGIEGVVRALHCSADGRFIVAASSDGTVRWLRTGSGEVALSLFVHGETGEWVAWTREGFYASSPGGDDLIGWQVNRSERERASFYRASQFERVLYRPDLVKAALSDRPLKSDTGTFDAGALAAIAPPDVVVELVRRMSTNEKGDRILVKVRARRTSSPMRSVIVFVDNVPLTRAEERRVRVDEGNELTREFEFVPPAKSDTLRVEVAGDHSIGVREIALPTDLRGLETIRRPRNLFVLSIGVQRFPLLPARFKLEFTEHDAQEIASFFRGQEGALFDHVFVKVVDGSSEAPTKARILDSLPFVEQAGPDDTVILFLASHGVRDARGNYFFATADATTQDLCAILGDTASSSTLCRDVSPSSGSSFVEWRAFYDALSQSAGRRVLIVDTCEAAGIAGDSEPGSLRKRSASSRFSLLLAAGNGEESQEYRAGRHGLFTYALLSAVSGNADSNGDGVVTLEEAYEWTSAEVSRLRDRRVASMTPILDAPISLRSLPLARAGAPSAVRR